MLFKRVPVNQANSHDGRPINEEDLAGIYAINPEALEDEDEQEKQAELTASIKTLIPL